MPNFDTLASNWDQYTYPWRPGVNTNKIIKNYIDENSRVCILGATKEFRKLGKDQGCYTDVYDTSLEMCKKNSVRNIFERVYHQNWFNISGKKYDVILGDLIFFLLDKQEQVELLNILKLNLSYSGIILIRTGGGYESTVIDYGLIQKTKKIRIYDGEFLNYLCYELVIGKGYSTKQVGNFIKTHNTQLYKYFAESYQNIVPYGNELFEKDCVSKYGKEIYRKNFLLSYEKLVLFHF